MRSLFICLILFSFVSCSNDEGYDDTAVRNKTWKLNSMTLSQSVDLNRDGIASYDMVDEFPCMANETFYLESHDNGFIFWESNFFFSGNGSELTDASCSEPGTFFNPAMTGTYKMIAANKLELAFEHFTMQPYKTKYTLENGKLVSTETRSYPAVYNETAQVWTLSQMEVRREYILVPNFIEE
jgi:hypothetical protein